MIIIKVEELKDILKSFDRSADVNVFLRLLNNKLENEQGILFNIEDWKKNDCHLDLLISGNKCELKRFHNKNFTKFQEVIGDIQNVNNHNIKKTDEKNVEVLINVFGELNYFIDEKMEKDFNIDESIVKKTLEWKIGQDFEKLPLEILLNMVYCLKNYFSDYYNDLIRDIKDFDMYVPSKMKTLYANDIEFR